MDDWVLDSLVGFLKSPTWTIPVNSFTDNKCVGKSYSFMSNIDTPPATVFMPS